MIKYITHSAEETLLVGQRMAEELLKPGFVVALFGDLGAGKTKLIQGMCKGLGVREHVSSPTFTLVNEYVGARCKIYHFDFYRINSVQEITALGFEEYLTRGEICLIEWSERAMELLPPMRTDIHMQLGEHENEREITINETTGVEV